MTPGEELLFCALGGSGEIGMNVNLYGTQGQWLMVDLGLTFADPGLSGNRPHLPTSSSSREQRDKLPASS
jgi:ribonuclease J